jgi:hypothetical protein
MGRKTLQENFEVAINRYTKTEATMKKILILMLAALNLSANAFTGVQTRDISAGILKVDLKCENYEEVTKMITSDLMKSGAVVSVSVSRVECPTDDEINKKIAGNTFDSLEDLASQGANGDQEYVKKLMNHLREAYSHVQMTAHIKDVKVENSIIHGNDFNQIDSVEVQTITLPIELQSVIEAHHSPENKILFNTSESKLSLGTSSYERVIKFQ